MLCAAQVLVQIGAFFWPALLPEMIARWRLSNSEAGWITAAFYGAYMLAVPVLVTLTDRIDAKRVYLGGVAAMILGHALFAALADGFWSAFAARALTGIGWAGTYMTGLKLLADKVDAKTLSRAAAAHAASIGISGALSYVCADLLAAAGGWRFAFAAASASAVVAWLIVLLAVPRSEHKHEAAPTGTGLFDFRPVLRNRSAMAYAIAYGLHTLEMAALRGWGVAFLAYVAASSGAANTLISPTVTLTALALLGTLASLAGNEAAIYFGRRTLISAAIGGSVALAVLLAMFGVQSYPLAVVAHARLRRGDLAGFGIAHRRDGWHRRTIPARCNARGSFVPRLCGRLHRAACGRLRFRRGRWQCFRVVRCLRADRGSHARVAIDLSGHASARARGRSGRLIIPQAAFERRSSITARIRAVPQKRKFTPTRATCAARLAEVVSGFTTAPGWNTVLMTLAVVVTEPKFM